MPDQRPNPAMVDRRRTCRHCSAIIGRSDQRCSNGAYCTPIDWGGIFGTPEWTTNDDLNAHAVERCKPSPDGCHVDRFSSRACERGTRSCTVQHTANPPDRTPSETASEERIMKSEPLSAAAKDGER